MQTEYFLIDNGSKSKIVEDFGAILPGICISILFDSLIIEPILVTNCSAFVISSQKSDMSRVFYFQSKQKLERLHRIISSIDIITHKDVS